MTQPTAGLPSTRTNVTPRPAVPPAWVILATCGSSWAGQAGCGLFARLPTATARPATAGPAGQVAAAWAEQAVTVRADAASRPAVTARWVQGRAMITSGCLG